MMRILRASITVIVFILFHYNVVAQYSKVTIGFYKALPKGEQSVIDPESKEVLYYNPDEIICNNNDFSNVAVIIGEYTNSPVIRINFTEAGADAIARATKENIGKKLLILADGKLLSAPMVRSEITDGKIEISGAFSLEKAKDLAQKIGNTPDPILQIVEYAGDGKQNIEMRIRELDKALVSDNDTVLNRLLNEEVTFGHSNGWIQDKKAIINDLKSGILDYDLITQEGDIKATFWKSTGSVRRIIEVKGKYKKDAFAMRLSVLEVWVLNGFKWQLWSRQSVKAN